MKTGAFRPRLFVHDTFTRNSPPDSALISLVGGDVALLSLFGRAMLRAGVHSGEYYEASDADGRLVGYLVTMPPGNVLLSTCVNADMGAAKD